MPQIIDSSLLQLSEATYQNLQTVFDNPLFINEDSPSELEEFYKPIKEKQSLTVSQAVSLLSLLITLLSFLMGFLPDKEQKRIIAQNEIIIDQNENKLEETANLTKAVENLNNAVQALSEDLHNSGMLLNDAGDIENSDG